MNYPETITERQRKSEGKRYWRRARLLPIERIELMQVCSDSEIARCFGLSDDSNIPRQRILYGIPAPKIEKSCFCGEHFLTSDGRMRHHSGACARAWRGVAKPLKSLPKESIRFIRATPELRSIWAAIALFEGFYNWRLRHPENQKEDYFAISRSHDRFAAERQRRVRSRRRLDKLARVAQ